MNGNFAFDNPYVLFLLIIFLPILLFDKFSKNKKHIYKNLPVYLKRKLTISKIFFRIFLLCAIIALCGPRWGTADDRGEYRRQLDAVIAIDLSRSMETADMPDSRTRLEHGVEIIKETVSLMPENRYAVALGRSRGIIAVPLTYDNNAVLDLLDTLSGLSITGRGTNLETLLDAASLGFQDSQNTSKVIILVSDGESLSGSVLAAAKRCWENNITVIAVLTGSEEGGLVPESEEIYSKADHENMNNIAARTGGLFIDGNNEDSSRILISYLRSFSSETRFTGNKINLKSHWYIFVLFAIISFVVSKAILLKPRMR